MFFVKKLDVNGEIESLVTYDRPPVLKSERSVEISAEEYAALLAEIQSRWEAAVAE